MSFERLALLHLLPTVYMTGVIWFVQIVHYPLFGDVARADFAHYERRHAHLTSYVVMPAMLAELGLAGWLLAAAPPAASWLATVGAGLLAVVWLSTFLLQVPCHRRLEHGFDTGAWRRLVWSNWLRTIAWTMRSLLAASLLW